MLSFSYSTRYKRGGGIIRRTEQKRRKATEGYSDYSWFPRQHSIFYICYILGYVLLLETAIPDGAKICQRSNHNW